MFSLWILIVEDITMELKLSLIEDICLMYSTLSLQLPLLPSSLLSLELLNYQELLDGVVRMCLAKSSNIYGKSYFKLLQAMGSWQRHLVCSSKVAYSTDIEQSSNTSLCI